MDLPVILRLNFLSCHSITCRYLYSNGIDIADGVKIIQEVKVTSSKDMIDRELDASDVFLNDSKCTVNMQLIGNLCGYVTITRVGIRAKIEDDYTPAVKVKMVVQGYVGDCQDTVKLYENTFGHPHQAALLLLTMPKRHVPMLMMVFVLNLKYRVW